MKKTVVLTLLIALFAGSLFAGDVAVFVDKGFTEDGKYYVFGQYGKTDKKFQGWAEIYQVDVAANDYVDAGVFKTKPSAVTTGKNGQDVYQDLEAKSFYYMKDYKTETAEIDNVFYILDDIKKTGTDVIEFTDFRGELGKQNRYKMQLVPTVKGSGTDVKSSFYINVEKYNSEGKKLDSWKVGTPGIVRKGVYNYKIERIFCDKQGKNLIFVIEKMMNDDTGISVRYMVEAAPFN